MIIKQKLGPKGQLLLPKSIRELLGIKPGEEIFIEVLENEVKIRSAVKPDEYLANFYEVPKKFQQKVNIEKVIEEEYSLEGE